MEENINDKNNIEKEHAEIIETTSRYISSLEYRLQNWEHTIQNIDEKQELISHVEKIVTYIFRNKKLHNTTINKCVKFYNYFNSSEYKEIVEELIYGDTGYFYNKNKQTISAYFYGLGCAAKPLLYLNYFTPYIHLYLPDLITESKYAIKTKGIYYFFRTLILSEEQRSDYYELSRDIEKFTYIEHNIHENNIDMRLLNLKLQDKKYRFFIDNIDFYYLLDFYNEDEIPLENFNILIVIALLNILKYFNCYYSKFDTNYVNQLAKEEQKLMEIIYCIVKETLNDYEIKYIEDYISFEVKTKEMVNNYHKRAKKEKSNVVYNKLAAIREKMIKHNLYYDIPNVDDMKNKEFFYLICQNLKKFENICK